MNTCDTCKWWEFSNETRGERDHICINSKITDDSYENENYAGEDALTFQYDEGGKFFSGPKFGCIHWEKIHLTEFNKSVIFQKYE